MKDMYLRLKRDFSERTVLRLIILGLFILLLAQNFYISGKRGFNKYDKDRPPYIDRQVNMKNGNKSIPPRSSINKHKSGYFDNYYASGEMKIDLTKDAVRDD